MAAEQTTLVISGVSIPVGAARGVLADWRPVDAGQHRRLVDGTLVWTGRDVFRKWSLTLQCTDVLSPTLAELWPGSMVSVQWPGRHRIPGATSATLPRDPVPASVRGRDDAGVVVQPTSVSGRDVSFSTAPVAIEYRPQLQMMVVEHSGNLAEWDREEGWSIRLEEV